MRKGIHYFILLAILITGVTAAIFINDQIRIYQANKAIEKIGNNIINTFDQLGKESIRASLEIKKQFEKEQRQRRINAKEKRKRSTTGVYLWKNCTEWISASQDMPNRTTQEGKLKHCNLYNDYINTGKYVKTW